MAGMSDPGETLHYEMNRRGGSPVLVGRAAEMAALQAAFDTVRQGGPAALLIGGEAGVGKTRLIGEFAATRAARGRAGADRRLPRAGGRRAAVRAVHRDAARPRARDGRRRGRQPAAGQRPGHTGAGPAASRARGRRPTDGAGALGEARGPALRGVPDPARAAGGAAAAGAGGRGRALGRPVKPRPARVPHRLPARARQRADRRHLPLRRAAPHPPAAAAAGRADPDRLGRADRAAEADPRARRRSWRRRCSAASPTGR